MQSYASITTAVAAFSLTGLSYLLTYKVIKLASLILLCLWQNTPVFHGDKQKQSIQQRLKQGKNYF